MTRRPTSPPHRVTVDRAGRHPALVLATRLGPRLRVPLDDVPHWRGGLLPRLALPATDVTDLPRADRCRLLRHLRALLVPGGSLLVDGPPAAREAAAPLLARDAWLCGFAGPPAADGDVLRLATPAPAPADGDGPPLVSILIPAYKPRHFRLALASALAQTYPRCEIVVGDDDATGAIAAQVAELAGPDGHAGRHPVRHVRHDPPRGGRGNYRWCLDAARGRYVKFLNDDDLLAPDAVARLAAALAAHPEVALATSYRRLIDAADTPLPDGPENAVPVDEDAVLDGRWQAADLLGGGINVVGEPTTVLFRRADALANRPHLFAYAGRSARRNGDLHLWTTLLSRGDAAWLVAPLSSFRRHDAQVQQDPAFRREALRAWDELAADADATGLLGSRSPARPEPWPLRPEPPAVLLDRVADAHAAGDAAAALAAARAAVLAVPRDPQPRNDLVCLLWEEKRRHRAVAEALLALAALEAGVWDPAADQDAATLRDTVAAVLAGTGRRREAAALLEMEPVAVTSS